jgi:hypothetical protein
MSVETVPPASRVILKDLSFDHELWDNEMKYFRNELEIFDHRMEEIIGRSENRDFLREFEHFQNQFIRQNEVWDILNQKVRKHRKKLMRNLADVQSDPEHEYFNEHARLREEFDTFVRIYTEIKNKFFVFLDKYL